MNQPLTKQHLDQLQRLRASVVAFQTMIAPLAAQQRDNSYNEQFNQLRAQAQGLIKTPEFEQAVPLATTESALQSRQISTLRNLSLVIILGIMLALIGLGINAIILEDFVINTIGCCISSAGMLLVMGSFGLVGTLNIQRRVTSLGDLYQRCNLLLYQLDHTLNLAMPELAHRPTLIDTPPMTSVLELALDSLNKQAIDWQQKLQALQEQYARLDPNIPLVLTVNIDFVQRELEQVKAKIEQLHGQLHFAERNQPTLPPVPNPEAAPVKEIVLPGGRKIALSKVDEPLMPLPLEAPSEEFIAETPLLLEETPTEESPKAATPLTMLKPHAKSGTRPNQPVSHEEVLRLAQQGDTAHAATMAMPATNDETKPLSE